MPLFFGIIKIQNEGSDFLRGPKLFGGRGSFSPDNPIMTDRDNPGQNRIMQGLTGDNPGDCHIENGFKTCCNLLIFNDIEPHTISPATPPPCPMDKPQAHHRPAAHHRHRHTTGKACRTGYKAFSEHRLT